ncbi:MAG: aspartate aminotransferase family protein [bacterium]|nr:aspartate aminotransferase family protein [bacterium]
MTSEQIIARNRAFEIGLYARFPVAFVRGDGARLWDADGRSYLDFFAGLAVNNLGHCHPAVVEAIRHQAGQLLHVSNLYHSAPVGELAELLCTHTFAARAFLCNSGAEANEAAMKLARRWGSDDGGGRYEILATVGSFHGRTFGTLTATGQEKYHQGFRPLLPGIRLVPFDDLAATEAAIAPETVAILVEPIQGEGGVVVPGPEYLRGLRALCDRRKLLLILDEIQTGLGRTGTLFAHEQAGIVPDIMSVAKALGGGVPIGAMLTTATLASVFTPGSHGTTFGGNLLACAAAAAAVRELAKPSLLEHVRTIGARFQAGLARLAARHPRITAVRGTGLMWGAILDGPGRDVVERALDRGLLINCTADRVLRFLPPLVLTEAEMDEGMAILDEALAA